MREPVVIPSREDVERIREDSERKLSPEEFEAYVSAPMSDAEREEILALVSWFTRRYPTVGERLAYARQVFEGDGKAAPDTAEMLAMIGSTSRMNLLKPNPANAMVAYMMLASDGDGTISDIDSLGRDA